jgi:hypothetical protein
VLQVVDDRRAGIAHQRQPISAAALSGDNEFAAAPVDVVQTERGDFPRA